jgi:hypothetical protein
MQSNLTCVFAIEEGRGHMRILSSQEVTKLIRNGAVSYQLTHGGRGRESLGKTVNLLMCDREGALYSVHVIVY